MTKNEMREQVAQLQLQLQNLAATFAEKPKAKKKKKEEKPAQPQEARVQVTPRLEALEGGLEPIGQVLSSLKPTKKSVEGVERLREDTDDYFERPSVPASTGVKADHVRRAWSTIVHIATNSEDGADLKLDLKDFRGWCRDPMFLRAINLCPELAVCWFVDVVTACFED